LNERIAEFAIGHKAPEGMTTKESLAELKNWVETDGIEKR